MRQDDEKFSIEEGEKFKQNYGGKLRVE